MPEKRRWRWPRYWPLALLGGVAIAGASRAVQVAVEDGGDGQNSEVSDVNPQVRIDPGHGGADPGAVNPSNGTMEKTIALEASLTLKFFLEQRGLRSSLSRSGDTRPSYAQRVKVTSELVLVSLHYDTSLADQPFGVYYMSDAAPTLEAESQRLASSLARALGQAVSKTAWVRPTTASRFGRLYIDDCRVPAVLVELGAVGPVSQAERVTRVSSLVPVLTAFVKEFNV